MYTTASSPSRDSDSEPPSTPRIIHNLPRKTTACGTHSDPSAPSTQTHRSPRLIPSQWTKLDLTNRSPHFPDVYIAPSHSGVPAVHGNIYIIVVSMDPEDLHETFAHGASLSSFCSLEEAAAKGSHACDFLIIRDKYGREEDGDSKDAVKSWSHAKKEFPIPVLEQLQKLRDDIYGKDKLMSDSKATTIDGNFCGGIAIERTFRSQFHIRNAQRVYHLTTSFQETQGLEAPHQSNKSDNSKETDYENVLRQRINELAIRAANEGLCKGAPHVSGIMTQWADLANFPKTGGFDCYAGFSSSVNFWPASQMNLASARRGERYADGNERLPPTDEDADAWGSLKKYLGKYGSNHSDGGDHTVIPTAMTNFIRPHPDVPEECFCLMEFGIVWVLEEFCTLFFSGLHMHGGGLAQYRPLHTIDSIYTRVTVILYPPQAILSGESALAFAALPYPPDPCRACQKWVRKDHQMCRDVENLTPNDDKDEDEEGDEEFAENAKVLQKRDALKTSLLKLPMEWCRRGMHQLSVGRKYTKQATYVSNGGSFLAPQDHFNHSIHSLLQWINGIIQQFPPHYFVRFDKDLLLSMFSMELDGVRLAAEPWDLGPGWTGDNVQIGSKSDVSVKSMSPQQIAQRWNTNDCGNLAPYGNTNIKKVEEAFYTLAEEMGQTIPLNAKAFAQQIIFLIGPKIAIIHICRELMSQWLSLGSEATYKSAQVVQFFVNRLGAEVTLLDLQKFDVSTPTKMADLQAQLEKAMIINQDSAPDQVKLTLILSKTPRCDALDFGSSLPFFLRPERLTISESARVFSGVLPSVSSNQGLLSLSSSSQSLHLNALTNGTHGNVKRLQLMYEVLYPLLDGVSEPYPPFNETPELTAAIRNFLDYVNADMDRLSIFRDLASSRFQSLWPGGLWDSDNLHTCAGFFSALICQGIIHCTAYLEDPNNPVFFSDENAWNLIRYDLQHHQEEQYFCNQKAYSEAPSAKRTSTNTSQYWNAASDARYNWFLTAKEPTPFLRLWNHFRSTKFQDPNWEHRWVKVFPKIGDLQAYLLASDYAIAGLATTPTHAEMAVVLWTVNARGIKGLRLLNLPCSSDEEITSSFQYIHKYLSQAIPLQRQQQMKFNIFVVEHSLCKYSSSK
ncbi:hypothetical protein EDD18DRAFT_1365298 [Armillaria luteobubalina]|uniref:Uncharacterized protein n=1 Tax=Armillaria luteobubalina TaxID=153913 RepID=A0AA39TBB9_9AGAR|nr:hypothetical protein EDD18DRAFT_1365298 [Armillaria luteobubalina]